MKKRNNRWLAATALLSVTVLAACGQDKDSSRGLRPDPEPSQTDPLRTEPETPNPSTTPESGMPEVLDTGNLKVAPFDKAVLDDTFWQGFIVADQDTGETDDLEMNVEFWSEGNGILTEYDDVTQFTWESVQC